MGLEDFDELLVGTRVLGDEEFAEVLEGFGRAVQQTVVDDFEAVSELEVKDARVELESDEIAFLQCLVGSER